MQIPTHALEAIRAGRVCIVIGAGCSLSSSRTTVSTKFPEIPTTTKLCEEICKKAGIQYSGEGPRDVFSAVKYPEGPLSDQDLKELFSDAFLECLPASEMNDLVSFSWRRIYTFNVDDVLRNTRRDKRAQKLKFINSLRERRIEWGGLTECQVIYLHGYAAEYENGLIFSREEYSREMVRSGGWYDRLAEDFVSNTLIVIGSSLDEPILDYHISRLGETVSVGQSYVITPGKPSPIQVASLSRRGFNHVQGTLRDFVHALKVEFPGGLAPADIPSDIPIKGLKLTDEDIEGLRSLIPISHDEVSRRKDFSSRSIGVLGRKFYDGYGPDLITVAKGIPASLKQDEKLSADITRLFHTGAKGVCLIGEAGSGKSTFLTRYLMNSGKSLNALTYKYVENSTPIESCLIAFEKYLDLENKDFGVVLVDDFQIYAEQISELLQSGKLRKVRILCSARKSEWAGRLVRFVANDFKSIMYSRFSEEDIPEIISKLTEFYPSPAFTKLTAVEKKNSFLKSKKQLLVALREATQSERFDDTIRDEIEKLSAPSSIYLLAIICWATIARVGIRLSTCESVYSYLPEGADFQRDYAHLSGIVDQNSSGRLVARHELYASVIVEQIIDSKVTISVLKAFFSYYSQFDMPVLRTLDKVDGQLFKFCLNNKNIYDLFNQGGQKNSGVSFFADFAVAFQLDGHFWLQWGLYLRKVNEQKEALNCFENSIDAHPDSGFARHALAQQRLIVAGESSVYGPMERRMISAAVEELTIQHTTARAAPWRVTSEEYPIVTLSTHHIDCLLKLKQKEEAKEYGRKYFSELDQLYKKYPASEHIVSARERVFRYITLGTWDTLKKPL